MWGQDKGRSVVNNVTNEWVKKEAKTPKRDMMDEVKVV